MRFPMYEGKEEIPGKTVIITGANTGIGKETARDLAKRGGRIILACRNLEKGEQARKEIVEETKNEEVVLKELDLCSFASIQAFAKDFNENEARLDILINNAGIMFCPKMLTKEGLEMHMGTNHIGHFLLTNLLLDKLKASAPSRIVLLSSMVHKNGKINLQDFNSEKSYSAYKAYFNSKLANILHGVELTKRLQGTGVTVNSVHPGVVRTELVRHTRLFRVLTAPFKSFLMKSPVEGAQTTLLCALSPDLETVSGKYFEDCQEKRPSALAQDEELAKKLWDISEEIIREKLAQASDKPSADSENASPDGAAPVEDSANGASTDGASPNVAFTDDASTDGATGKDLSASGATDKAADGDANDAEK